VVLKVYNLSNVVYRPKLQFEVNESPKNLQGPSQGATWFWSKKGFCVNPYSNDDQQEYEPSPVSSTGLSWSPSASQSSNGDGYEFGWPVVNEAPPGSEGDDDGSGVEDGTGMDVDEDS